MKTTRHLVSRGLVLALTLLAACGGGGDGASEPPPRPVYDGVVVPNAAGLQFTELDSSGQVLQTSSVSDRDGKFRFPRPLSGARVVVTLGGHDRYSVPLRLSAPLPVAGDAVEVSVVSTVMDDAVRQGEAAYSASRRIGTLLRQACAVEIDASRGLPKPAPESTLAALLAYLRAFHDVGFSADTPGISWLSELEEHAGKLSKMCDVSARVYATGFLDRLRDAMKTAGVGDTIVGDDAALRETRADATRHVLGLMGRRLATRWYPELDALHVAAVVLSTDDASALVVRQAVELGRLRAEAGVLAGTEGVATVRSVEVAPDGRRLEQVGLQFAAGASAPARARLVNAGTATRSITLGFDGVQLFDPRNLVEQILRHPAGRPGEPLHERAWRFVMHWSRHGAAISPGRFMHQADLFLRSIGTGLCDDQASALAQIWRMLGYESRVWGIGGHVVPEVLADGRWQMFDPNYRVVYRSADGAVAGVEQLQAHPEWILRPPEEGSEAAFGAHGAEMAERYADGSDNAVIDWYSAEHWRPLQGTFQLPPGGELRLLTQSAAVADYGDFVAVELHLPAGFEGTVDLPLVLIDVTGSGRLAMLGHVIDVSVPGTREVLHDHYQRSAEVGVASVDVSAIGPSGLVLTMLLNPRFLEALDGGRLAAVGEDLSALRWQSDTARN